MAKKYRQRPRNTDGEFYVCEPIVYMKRLKNQKVYNSRYTSIWRLKLLLKENLQKKYRDIADLYERLAKGGIECSITVDDKNGIYTIYSHGVELADNSESR